MAGVWNRLWLSSSWLFYMTFVIITVVLHDFCYHHSCLTRLLLDSFFYFAMSNSSHPLVNLIFLLILSIHVTLVLSYPSLHVHYLTLLILLQNVLVYFYDIIRTREEYLLVRRRAVLVGQLEHDLGAHQFIGKHLDLVLDRDEPTWDRNRYCYLIFLDF